MVSLISREKELGNRRYARFHVQLEIEDFSERSPGPGWMGFAHVKGRLRRIFRADESLQVGSEVHFEVCVYSDSDQHKPRGDDVVLRREHLTATKYAEVILHGDPPTCRLFSFLKIEAPSRRPQLFIPNLLQWWWIKRSAERRLHAHFKGVAGAAPLKRSYVGRTVVNLIAFFDRRSLPITLMGAWRFMRAEGEIDATEGMELQFFPDGSLEYRIPEGDTIGIIKLTYRIDGNEILIDQLSAPRGERTWFRFEDRDILVLSTPTRRAWFERAAR